MVSEVEIAGLWGSGRPVDLRDSNTVANVSGIREGFGPQMAGLIDLYRDMVWFGLGGSELTPR